MELYKIKVQTIKNYYIFEKDLLVSQKEEEVKEYLKCLNCKYGNDENELFYLVKTPIKFFDDKNFDEELKKKIFLVDLPGCDTNENKFNEHYNKIERTVYEKLLDISSSFVFINKGRAIGNIENREILKNAYNVISDNSSLGNNYLENCLFIINMFNNLNENEKNKQQIQMDFSNIIFDGKENHDENSKFINTELFNAKAYFEYINEITDLINFKDLLFKYKKIFLNKKRKKLNFINFCLSSIEKKFNDSWVGIKIEEDKIDKKEKEENDMESNFKDKKEENKKLIKFEDIEKEIKLIMNDQILQYDETKDKENLKKFSYILQYMINKKENNKFYINSNCEKFFNILEAQIDKANKYTERNYKNNLIECFKFFDLIFEKDINSDNSKKTKIYKEKFEELKKN